MILLLYFQKIAEEYCEENEIDIRSVACHSGRSGTWKCPICDTKYVASFNNRSHGTCCPNCRGDRIWDSRVTNETKDMLSNKYPNIAAELKDKTIDPSRIYPCSNKEYDFVCGDCGYEYKQKISNRTRLGRGCPKCNRIYKSTSFPEQIILYYLSRITMVESRSIIGGVEVDIFLPDLKTAIEYNGEFFHKSKQINDSRKKEILDSFGINLITIHEHKDTDTLGDDQSNIHYKYDRTYKRLENVVYKVFEFINVQPPHIDIEQDRFKINNRLLLSRKDNSFGSKHRELLSEWDYIKNGCLSPYMFTEKSGERVWFVCENGHSYKTEIRNRSNGHGCPYCVRVRKAP